MEGIEPANFELQRINLTYNPLPPWTKVMPARPGLNPPIVHPHSTPPPPDHVHIYITTVIFNTSSFIGHIADITRVYGLQETKQYFSSMAVTYE